MFLAPWIGLGQVGNWAKRKCPALWRRVLTCLSQYAMVREYLCHIFLLPGDIGDQTGNMFISKKISKFYAVIYASDHGTLSKRKTNKNKSQYDYFE